MTSGSRPVGKSSEFEELSREICSLQQQLQLAEEHLRMFEPDLGSMTSMEELESCEKLLEDLLDSVTNRKEQLESNLVRSYHPKILEGTILSSPKEGQSSQRSTEVLNWLPDGCYNGLTLDSPIVNVDTRDDISTPCVPLEESSCNLNLGNMKDGRNSGAEYPDVMPLNEELKTGELAKHETKMLLQD
ncbi:agamous-like MADS-box protein AGL104 [Coffea arabica]|uniref:Agamous-like MADS-box protein AGL104 n=1 Tax=Coffea arabica TaxID=13443 RepID=A0ABM4VWY9_COFAR